MTHEEVVAMIAETGLPNAYDHFAEGESPDPPFICFLYPRTDTFGADDVVYHQSPVLHIEVYTDYKDPEIEAAVEKILTAHELFYSNGYVKVKTTAEVDTEVYNNWFTQVYTPAGFNPTPTGTEDVG